MMSALSGSISSSHSRGKATLGPDGKDILVNDGVEVDVDVALISNSSPPLEDILFHVSHSMLAQEDQLPSYVDYRKPHVEACLRDLDDFSFFVSTTQELVSLEDISLRPMSGAGIVLSQVDGSGIPVILQEILEWFVEFGVSREECAIWVKTPIAR